LTNSQQSFSNIDKSLEKLEIEAKENNIRLFDLEEERNGETCERLVLELFQDTMPKAKWKESDILSAQRIGRRSPADQRPRIAIVKLARWTDKMYIL